MTLSALPDLSWRRHVLLKGDHDDGYGYGYGYDHGDDDTDSDNVPLQRHHVLLNGDDDFGDSNGGDDIPLQEGPCLPEWGSK